jgi:hypothetical protein
MVMPYRARVDERWFLNFPGFHEDECMFAYVEDTTHRGLYYHPNCDEDCEKCPSNFEPKMVLEIGESYRRAELAFDVDSEAASRTRCTSSTP